MNLAVSSQLPTPLRRLENEGAGALNNFQKFIEGRPN
jgi:hypothetical protein